MVKLAVVSCLLTFVLPVAALAAPQFSVTPYLQHPATNAMTIIFFTDSPCAATVTYWPVAEYPPPKAPEGTATWGAATVRSVAATCELATNLVAVAGRDDVAKWGTQYRHKARLTGLAPGTAYGYDVALPGEGGAHYANTFKTVPDRNTPVKFVAYSDSETVPPDFVDGSGNNHAIDGRTKEWDVRQANGQNKTMTYHVSRSVGFASNLLHMAAWKPDLYLVAGDLAARGGPQILWDEYWKEMAGGLGLGYGDPAGAAPILATIGNHDLYDNDGSTQYSLNYNTPNGGATALGKFKTYFEFPSNGDSQYDQQYFRQDYGPVTLLFIDSNNGTTGSVSPPFSSGSTMYKWLKANLADAQKNARFTFLIQHHCPYSFGKHNASGDGQTAVKIRKAIEDLVKTYGVTAWLGGHEEMQEHSQLPCGTLLSNGLERVVNIFDLGSAGDGLKGARISGVTNPYNVFRAYEDSPDGTHYGHLQIEVAPSNGVWYCTMTPAYSYFKDANSPSELRYYKDKVIVKEGGEIVYQEAGGWVPPDDSTVRYTGTVEEKEVDGDAVYIFKTDGTLTLPTNVVADILVVGGGGGGGPGGSSEAGTGGNGAEVLYREGEVLAARTWTVSVGSGGSAGSGQGTGGSGGKSSFGTFEAAGGSGGARKGKKNGSNGTGYGQYDFAGTETYYGAGGSAGSGLAVGTPGTANTGMGGQGGASGSRNGGAGGSGVVIVRIVQPVALTEPLVAEATYDGMVQTPAFEGITVELGDWNGTPQDVGTYHGTARGTGRFTGEVGVTFTINPAPVTVTADDKQIAPGDPEPELTVTVTGLQGGDQESCISYSLEREPGDTPDEYDIFVTGETVQGNYTVSFVNGRFTIREKMVFEPGQDAVIEVSGPTVVDVGEKAIAVGKVTIKGSGELKISNCQNLTANSIDLSGLDGTVTYEYVSSEERKSLPSGLADAIRSQTDQKVRYAFRGTSAANGWSFGDSKWSGTAGKALIQTHLVLEEGTHAWTVEVSSDNTSTYFGANGTDANPTLLIRDGATLNFTVHDLSGYKGAMNAGGVIRVNAGGRLNILALTSGSYHNFNYRQRLVLDPGSETTFDYSSSYLFVIHGGSDIGGDAGKAQVYVPEGDGTAGPAILRRKSSNGAGLCINGNSASRGGGCAIYVGAGSKLLLDSNVKSGESDSGTGDRTLAKYGAGELEITGEVTKDVAFKAYEGIVTLPASSGAFNGGLTATADVTYRFPKDWAADVPYTLGSGTVSGTASAEGSATVYVGSKKLPGATLTYSGKTVTYSQTRDFFSIALDLDPTVDTSGITVDKVKVKSVQLTDGGIRLTVGIEGLPVGENALEEYLGQVFGVTGTASLDEKFTTNKVTYGNMTNNKDGTVSFTAEPKVADGAEKPKGFFFKATVTK